MLKRETQTQQRKANHYFSFRIRRRALDRRYPPRGSHMMR